MGFVTHPVPRDPSGMSLRLDGTQDPLKETRLDLATERRVSLDFAIALVANVSYSSSTGDDNVIVLPANPLQPESREGRDDLEYQRFTALLGARWFL